jgi:hypothetical protein
MNELAGFALSTIRLSDIEVHRLSDIEVQVLDLNTAGRLGYVKPSDEWFDLSEPLPDDLQDAATRLFEAGWLPEFEDASTEETAS